MKEDIGELPPVPKKRRQLEQALDLHLAMWLAREDLTPSERRRVQEEKERRKERVVPVIVGFTGTRAGMTPEQKARVRELLEGATEAHHGDCVGADATFHELCLQAQVPVVLHPPENNKARAFCKNTVREEKALPYLKRNQEIVKASTLMIGTPKETYEPAPARGQGTWSTIRYARTRGVRLKVVMPDGTIQGEPDGR